MAVEPSGPANGAVVNPSVRSFTSPATPGSVPTTGETGTWTLNTAGMLPCGYVIHLSTSDRTIVSGGGGWPGSAIVGFCLRKP